MVFQSYAVFPHMKVCRQRFRPPHAEGEEAGHRRARALLRRAAAHRGAARPLLVAAVRRTAAAWPSLAIATKADVLLMDKALSNLDALLRLEMQAELKSLLHGLEATTIYVTHDQIEALSMGDRIAVMNKAASSSSATRSGWAIRPTRSSVGSSVIHP